MKRTRTTEYTLSVAAPGGYNPTTVTSLILQLGAGEVSYVNFGAQANSSTLAEAPVLPSEGRRSPMLGILGGLFLVGGVILALLAARLIKSR